MKLGVVHSTPHVHPGEVLCGCNYDSLDERQLLAAIPVSDRVFLDLLAPGFRIPGSGHCYK